jgi:hypothetical protein
MMTHFPSLHLATIQFALRRALGAFLALLLASCAVTFVAPYDQITDEAVQELAKKTEIFITDVTLARGSYSQHAGFYREVEGSLGAIELRASLYPKNEGELDLINRLRTAFQKLKQIHQEVGPFRPAEAEPVRSLLRSLIQVELAKKRSAGISTPTRS